MKNLPLLFFSLLLLTSCTTSKIKNNESNQISMPKLECDMYNVDLGSLNFLYDDKDIILSTQDELIQFEEVASDICEYINENDGMEVTMTRPSYNWWGFTLSDDSTDISVVIHSTEPENINHHLIITFLKDEEIEKYLMFYYDSKELEEFIQILKMK